MTRLLFPLAFAYGLHLVLQGMHELLLPFQIYLHLHALFVVYPAFCLGGLRGLFVVLCAAGLVAAPLLVPLGPIIFTFVGLWVLLTAMRPRLKLNSRAQVGAATALAQGAAIFVLSIAFGWGRLTEWTYWQRLAIESFFSLPLIFFTAPYWLELQGRLLRDFDDRAPEARAARQP